RISELTERIRTLQDTFLTTSLVLLTKLLPAIKRVSTETPSLLGALPAFFDNLRSQPQILGNRLIGNDDRARRLQRRLDRRLITAGGGEGSSPEIQEIQEIIRLRKEQREAERQNSRARIAQEAEEARQRAINKVRQNAIEATSRAKAAAN